MDISPILNVHFYLTRSGTEPVRRWLKTMSSTDRKIIGEDIKLVQYRWPLGTPLVKKMEADLWEIRSNLGGGNIARIFFTVSISQMILLHGIIKKSQKTPKQDIELARKIKNQWFNEVPKS